MIDKNKVAIIGAALGVAAGLLIAGIIWVVANSSGNETDTAPANTPISKPLPATATPGQQSDPPAPELETEFDVDQGYADTAVRVAITAASWDGSANQANRRKAYEQAGFSDQLVKSFTPLWQPIFDVPKVSHYLNTFDQSTNIAATTTGNLDGEPDLVDTAGQDPHEQYRFAVDMTYRANWDQKAGSDDFNHEGKATWVVTVDQATGKAVAVAQPRDSMSDLVNAINAAKSRY